MKTLGVTLVLMCLWGCGPEQSSAQKDAAQNKTIADQLRSKYQPFNGLIYRGTLTKPSGGVEDVILNLSYSETQVTNPSRLETTIIPNLTGTFKICMLQTPCFAKDVSDSDGSQALSITSANQNSSGNLVLYVQGNCPSGGCNSVSSSDMASRTLDLLPGPHNTTLKGTYSDANGVYNLTLGLVNP